MKDQEVALIVVALAGLAFLMAKSTSDRPASNMRDFYARPAYPEAELTSTDPEEPTEQKKGIFVQAEAPGLRAENEMELWVRKGDGYSAYRASLDHAVGEVIQWQSQGARDPLREGLRKAGFPK